MILNVNKLLNTGLQDINNETWSLQIYLFFSYRKKCNIYGKFLYFVIYSLQIVLKFCFGLLFWVDEITKYKLKKTKQ